MLAIVLGYTAWTYWVVRQRVSPEGSDPNTKNPIEVMRRSGPTEETGPTSATSS